jgi:hypothetical protein
MTYAVQVRWQKPHMAQKRWQSPGCAGAGHLVPASLSSNHPQYAFPLCPFSTFLVSDHDRPFCHPEKHELRSRHTLRHAFITAALDTGVPLRDVQEAALG